jgi:hypothetical protein
MWRSKSGLSLSAEGETREARQLVEEFVSGILGHPLDVEGVLSAGERAMIFRQLSRAEELAKVRRPGERIVWKVEDLEAGGLERLPVPHLDQFIMKLRPRLPVVPAPPRTAWPDNRPFAVCLSHDMDQVASFSLRASWRQLRRMRRNGMGLREQSRHGWKTARRAVDHWGQRRLGRQPDRYGNVGEWLKLEADCGFKSSLFFFAETVHPWHPYDCNYGFNDRVHFEGHTSTVGAMMLEIAARGWDVGVHGSIASATEPGVLARQKEEVAARIGRPVFTTRQHYLQYDPARTPRIQAEAGLLADGTQGFNDTIGFRAGTSFPYRLWDWSRGCLLPLWQVALHIQDGPLLRAGPTVDQAVSSAIALLERVQEVGGCLGLLFHPAHLSTERGFTVYRELLQESRRRGAWGCSLKEAALWWQSRTRNILQGSADGARESSRSVPDGACPTAQGCKEPGALKEP